MYKQKYFFRLLEEIFHAHVTFLQITPSLLFHKWSNEHLKTTILDKDSQLRVLLLGGEPFPSTKSILKASHLQNTTKLFNIYGITEVSCWSSINEIVKENNIDESYLGEPLSETIFQIRNEDNEVITRGEGTLYIGQFSILQLYVKYIILHVKHVCGILYKLFFLYVSNIGSTNRVCIIENEIDEDLKKPIFRDTGDVVSVSKFYQKKF